MLVISEGLNVAYIHMTDLISNSSNSVKISHYMNEEEKKKDDNEVEGEFFLPSLPLPFLFHLLLLLLFSSPFNIAKISRYMAKHT